MSTADMALRLEKPLRTWPKFFVLAAAIPLLAIASLSVGPIGMDPGLLLNGLLGTADDVTNTVVQDIRLPRTLLSLLIGAVLGLAGAALQGYLRNPLAEPAILGASNAAALGAVVALYYGFAGAFFLALPLFAATSALVGMAGLIALSYVLPQQQPFSTVTLILCGIAISAVAGAAISLLLNLSPNPFAAMEITFWLLGSLEDRSINHVLLALPMIAAGSLLLVWDARCLDALSLGEEAAQSLGFNLQALRARIVAGVALGIGGAVAVSGTIGFLGLVTPHIARLWFKARPSQLLLPSALIGALLLTTADIAVRLIPTPTELKLGVVTALVGAPFLVRLMLRYRHKET